MNTVTVNAEYDGNDIEVEIDLDEIDETDLIDYLESKGYYLSEIEIIPESFKEQRNLILRILALPTYENNFEKITDHLKTLFNLV